MPFSVLQVNIYLNSCCDFLLNILVCRERNKNYICVRHAQATRQHLQSQLDELVSLSSADSVVASNDDDVKKVQQEIAAVFSVLYVEHCLLMVYILVSLVEIV